VLPARLPRRVLTARASPRPPLVAGREQLVTSIKTATATLSARVKLASKHAAPSIARVSLGRGEPISEEGALVVPINFCRLVAR